MKDISFHFLDIESEPINTSSLKKWIEQTIQLEGHPTGYLQFIFCDDAYLHQMNKQFLSHDSYTDIITFNYNDDFDGISGEMYISLDRVRDNARKYGAFLMDELHRVMIHGVLHLIGYQDESPDDQELMRSKENYYLSLLS